MIWPGLPRVQAIDENSTKWSRSQPAESRYPFADEEPKRPRRLRVSARIERDLADLEFIAGSGFGNIEDEIATLGEPDHSITGTDSSLRLLRHYASSVRHQKYRKTDVVTITVKRQG